MKLSLDEIRQALSEVNHYYTKKELGREPTPMECVLHYVKVLERREDPLVKWFEGDK